MFDLEIIQCFNIRAEISYPSLTQVAVAHMRRFVPTAVPIALCNFQISFLPLYLPPCNLALRVTIMYECLLNKILKASNNSGTFRRRICFSQPYDGSPTNKRRLVCKESYFTARAGWTEIPLHETSILKGSLLKLGEMRSLFYAL